MQVAGPGCGVSNPKFNREETTSLSFFLSWGSMRNRPDLAWRLRSSPLVSSPTLTLHAGRPDPSSAAGAGHGPRRSLTLLSTYAPALSSPSIHRSLQLPNHGTRGISGLHASPRRLSNFQCGLIHPLIPTMHGP